MTKVAEQCIRIAPRVVGTEIIERGPGHLGACPRCGAPITEISQRLNGPPWTLAFCDRGHSLIDPSVVYRFDAPMSGWPLP